MIIDLKTADEIPPISCDLCIVGTGAAGLTIACEMLPNPVRVVLVESGSLNYEDQTQDLYESDISALPHPGTMAGRFRVLGGSTTKWAGQALPLMRSDFERRDWVSQSGWPIGFDELSPYYARGCRFLLVDSMNFDTDLFAYLRIRPPQLDPDRLWYHFSKWSPRPSVREHHLAEITASDRCTLLLHANVTNIALGPDLTCVEALEVTSLEGRKTRVHAKKFVLCVGGIETARLLLTNNRQLSTGIGNFHDLVGRYFQDHPNAMVGWLESSNPSEVQRLFNVFHKRGLKYSVRCTATPRWQREQGALNASMGIIFVYDESQLQDLKDAYVAIRSRHWNTDILKKLLRVSGHPSAVLSPIWSFLVRGRSFAPGARFQVCITTEQAPNPESRILLSDRTDALGTRRADVRWKLSDLTRYTIEKFARTLGDELWRAGIGKIELEPWVRDSSLPWIDNVKDQFHHMGTARMHNSPRQGVVDADCRVHGIANLYIGSSAVFPTSGHSNPTLTIIALCMRLADHLKHELA